MCKIGYKQTGAQKLKKVALITGASSGIELETTCVKNPKIRYKVGSGCRSSVLIKRLVNDRLFDFILKMNLGV